MYPQDGPQHRGDETGQSTNSQFPHTPPFPGPALLPQGVGAGRQTVEVGFLVEVLC